MYRNAFKTTVRYVWRYVNTKKCEEDKNCYLQFAENRILNTMEKINSVNSSTHYFYYAVFIMPAILVFKKRQHNYHRKIWLEICRIFLVYNKKNKLALAIHSTIVQ